MNANFGGNEEKKWEISHRENQIVKTHDSLFWRGKHCLRVLMKHMKPWYEMKIIKTRLEIQTTLAQIEPYKLF